jgi:growth hormone-inducible transmembrane protein
MLATRLSLSGRLQTLKTISSQIRLFSNDVKTGTVRRSFRSRLFQQGVTAEAKPLTDTPLRMGRGLVAGASFIGLGALAFYGLGLSSEVGIAEKSALWPQYVRERVHKTYGYLGGGLGITAFAGYLASKSPMLLELFSRNSLVASLAMIAAVVGTGMITQSLPYDPNNINTKHLAWVIHASLLGAMLAPMALLGGAVVTRAAWYTAGIVGGLSTIAATAPSEKFLSMGGPLAVGLGAVFASSVAGMFLPPTTRLGLGLYSISLYGGLVLFSMFLLYDTQKIVHQAERAPHYDPINNSIHIYLDILNIFVRMVTILSGGGSRRK